MKDIIRENLNKLMAIITEAMEASENGDDSLLLSLEARMVAEIGHLDEATIKELEAAMKQLEIDTREEFNRNEERRAAELADMDAQLKAMEAIGTELDELNALTQESIEASERGDQKRLDEIMEIMRAKNAKLPPEFRYVEV